MKVLYATSMIYPSPLANRIQMLAMAREFHRLLGDKFYLGGQDIRGVEPHDALIQVVSFGKRKSIFLAFKYALFIRKHRISCVYSREERLLFLIVLYSTLLLGQRLRIVYEAHLVPSRKSLACRYVYRHASVVVALTSFIRRRLESMDVPTENIVVAPDGVDLSLFDIPVSKQEARAQVALPKEKRIVLYAGSFDRYVAWKGVDIFLGAVEHLPPDALIVLVGGREDELERMKKEYAGKQVMFVGRKAHTSIPLYVKAADVLVLPNKSGDVASEEYTSPMKLFEYMASGTPIVSSDLPSVREVLSEKSCVFVSPGSSRALADGIAKLAADQALGERIAAVAREDVRQYTWEKRAHRVMEYIRTRCERI